MTWRGEKRKRGRLGRQGKTAVSRMVIGYLETSQSMTLSLASDARIDLDGLTGSRHGWEGLGQTERQESPGFEPA